MGVSTADSPLPSSQTTGGSSIVHRAPSLRMRLEPERQLPTPSLLCPCIPPFQYYGGQHTGWGLSSPAAIRFVQNCGQPLETPNYKCYVSAQLSPNRTLLSAPRTDPRHGPNSFSPTFTRGRGWFCLTDPLLVTSFAHRNST